MKQYSKEDQEYISNGHYLIDGVEYMSIWTYKNKKSVGENSTQMNASEARTLASMGLKCISTKPDFGNFSQIYIYRVEDLDGYYL